MGARRFNLPSLPQLLSGLLGFDILLAFLDAVFSVTRTGARARRWAVILIGATLWAVVAYLHHPYRQGVDFGRSFWDYPFRALFAADVFRIILLGGLVFWIAYRVASVYLDDVFEIGDVEVAKRFLRQAAFADLYGRIEIANGRVADRDQQSPIFLIGGPGLVRVNLENAALFEKIDGWARVIPPTVHPRARENRPRDDFAILDGFERLRSAIDLRDHFEEMQVISRTRDGIRISAEDVRVIYSVYRDNREPTLSTPYPFVEEAIKTLVYSQSRLGPGTTDWHSVMAFLINQELGNFITQHTLEEFLAAVGQPELKQREEASQELQAIANQRAGTQALLTGVSTGVPQAPDFAHRSEISDLFYGMKKFVDQARDQGVALRWIGVGTWKIPDEIIPEQHQTAWRISRENLVRGGPVSLANLREESRLGELRVLVYDVPVGISRGMDRKVESRKREYMLALVHAYRGKLRSALDVYEREGNGDTMEARRLRRSLDHLAHVVYRYLGDSGNGA
jgi:hypothetical protein